MFPDQRSNEADDDPAAIAVAGSITVHTLPQARQWPLSTSVLIGSTSAWMRSSMA